MRLGLFTWRRAAVLMDMEIIKHHRHCKYGIYTPYNELVEKPLKGNDRRFIQI